jgi:D-beta-D-heptose 7-phosphate kinase/D-beta-D-heptose 1-phosphate adenosyltransferase
VLVKGGDYGLDAIHGRAEVEAAGGRVVSLPFVAGASTSAIIERMKKSRPKTEESRPKTDDRGPVLRQ